MYLCKQVSLYTYTYRFAVESPQVTPFQDRTHPRYIYKSSRNSVISSRDSLDGGGGGITSIMAVFMFLLLLLLLWLSLKVEIVKDKDQQLMASNYCSWS